MKKQPKPVHETAFESFLQPYIELLKKEVFT